MLARLYELEGGEALQRAVRNALQRWVRMRRVAQPVLAVELRRKRCMHASIQPPLTAF
jgi:hypothetical protein